MGGSKPTPPTIIMPQESNPQAFQTIIPQKSYKDLAESMQRTEREINRITDQRYDEVGTPAELGARQRAIEMQEAASYASSLPRGGSPDERFKETPRAFPIKSNRRATFDTVPGSMSGFGGSRPGTGPGPTGGGGSRGFSRGPIDPAKEAAAVRFEKSKKAYAKALNKAATTPRSFMPITTNPGFAQNPDDLYLPKVINAPDEEKK
jgi:hypothetical protein